MPLIDASLFAHIENDPFITGTYQLEGNYLNRTIAYLLQYINDRQTNKKAIPPHYLNLIDSFEYLKRIDESFSKLDTHTSSQNKFAQLITEITQDINQLKEGASLLLPGGFSLIGEPGHAMIYQVTKTKDGYIFTVFNSGDGINFHSKKSVNNVELYNPTKVWHVPNAQSESEQEELRQFITRLLQVLVPKESRKPPNISTLYKRILPSISHIHGVEQNANEGFPDHAYTEGQLSGTCAQGCVYEMLKVNSGSESEYQLFVFDFKIHALFDYAHSCLAHKQPFNSAVKNQIDLAIDGNLKLLNTQNLFNYEETQKHYQALLALKNNVALAPFDKPEPIEKSQEPLPQYIIVHPVLSNIDAATNKHALNAPTTIPQELEVLRKENLLHIIERNLALITGVTDPTIQYVYLKKLISSLPINDSELFEADLYSGLKKPSDFNTLQKHLCTLQDLLNQSQKKTVGTGQTPIFNHLIVSVLSLQADTQCVLTKAQNLPSFKPFTDLMMRSLVDNHSRDPFQATNDAVLDKRIKALEKRFNKQEQPTNLDFFQYYVDLLNTEPKLRDELYKLYAKKYQLDAHKLHEEIRKVKLEPLFMIFEHIANKQWDEDSRLDSKFDKLIEKIQTHLHNEFHLRQGIDLLFKDNELLSISPKKPHFNFENNQFNLISPLPIIDLPESVQTSLTDSKYTIQPRSNIAGVLKYDAPNRSIFSYQITPISANEIQLEPFSHHLNGEEENKITQEDIELRDYLHLRIDPKLQIPLTLDYFTRQISQLADETKQQYVEANLFQPGLLAASLQTHEFLPQFDRFLHTGKRYFSQHGRPNLKSILFFRLDFLVNRYFTQIDPIKGFERLQANYLELKKQLTLNPTPELTYVFNQYLFLTIMAIIGQGQPVDAYLDELFKAYLYLQSHTNPAILEDTAHCFEVETAFAQFKIVLNQQDKRLVKNIIQHTLQQTENEPTPIDLDGDFPDYTFSKNEKSLIINALSGKIFEDNLCRSGLPLALKNNPLIIQLGLNHIQTCLMNNDETYMILEDKNTKFYLFYLDGNLIIQKDWMIDGHLQRYELLALTRQHSSDTFLRPIANNLPRILTDGAMSYWQNTSTKDEGILVRNEQAEYLCTKNQIDVLDAKGLKTQSEFGPLDPQLQTRLNAFESTDYIIPKHSKTPGEGTVELPRYGLHFSFNTQQKTLIHQETKELIIEEPNPIHPLVGGLVLHDQSKNKKRILVPITQFYAHLESAVIGDFIPVRHDTSGIIAHSELEYYIYGKKREWQWHYQNSEHYMSFQLDNGQPIANTSKEALYLAYIYLATNQPEKAWEMLEECSARLGGLKGDPDELKLISWMCMNMPYTLAGSERDKQKRESTRASPAYVACQLKAMSLLSVYLSQDRRFDLKKPKSADNTANTEYAQREQRQISRFLLLLPTTIYHSYERYQAMRHDLGYRYQLSHTERKNLLDYYHQKQTNNKPPLGALGYEWMKLTLESIQEEYQALQARQRSEKNFSLIDKKRMEQIEEHIKQLKPVMAKSTKLELLPIDLSLDHRTEITTHSLKSTTTTGLDNWTGKLKDISLGDDLLQKALKSLSTKSTEDDFINNFAAYLQIAASDREDLRTPLLNFCTKTLLADRHLLQMHEEDNRTKLCNILYRVTHNADQFREDNPRDFKDLVKKCSTYKVPELKVYQAKDVFEEILAQPEQILAEHQRHVPQKIHQTTKSIGPLRAQIGINNDLPQNINKPLEVLIGEYTDLKIQNEALLKQLGTHLTDNSDEALKIEEEAGKQRFLTEQKKQKIAAKLLKNKELSRLVQNKTLEATTAIQLHTESVWKRALILANQGPDNPVLNLPWAIDRESRAKKTLTKADLMSLYVQDDATGIIEKTGLSLQQAKELHHYIHQALISGIRQQTAKKISDSLHDALEKQNPLLALQALDLLSQEDIPGVDQPAVVLLQHEEQILLFDRQVSSLKSLLSRSDSGNFVETVEKIIMGGGKSKVIIPILAEQKARGDNLIIVEVPQALLATNHEDLNRISRRLFGKSAFRFDFNRDSNCSPKQLKQIYSNFIEIMATKGYLVTTGEAMQSLELKYLELLLSNQHDNKEWKEQVYWCDKIINLVHHAGDCIIDEVHQGLSIKKKLNYTSGEMRPISAELIENATALFKLIPPEFIIKAPNLNKNYDWAPFKKELATKLIDAPMGPLSLFILNAVKQYGEGVKKELIAYLNNSSSEIPQAVLHASELQQEALAFFKHEINVVLPHTLTRRLKEHYGPSQRLNLSATEKTLAIPYEANNISKERSRFGNELESINYTIQMTLIEGISKELLIQQIIQWQGLARQEFLQNKHLDNIEDTPTAKGFLRLAKDLQLTLSQIDLADEAQVKKLHDYFQHNSALIYNCLDEKILNQIVLDREIIHSDSFNHVDLYRSTQGISGTPSNVTTFHQRLKYNQTASLGTDGYILKIIQEKDTPISSIDYQNTAQFITKALSSTKNAANTRTIIDLRATFQGVSNLAVAQEIAKYYLAQKKPVIQHVLYFNEQQILCAIDISKPDKPIVLATTEEDEIYSILGTTPAQRFTYYDQAHTVGTDIKQMPTANALVLADEKTPLRSAFLQGSMRMRGLEQEQSIEIIVPEHLNDTDLTQLIKQFALVENETMLRDNLTAAKLQMVNFMRRRCLTLIQSIPAEDAEAKRKITQLFKTFFIENSSMNLFANYGGLSKPEQTEMILKRYKKQVTDLWQKCVQAAEQDQIKIPDEDVETHLQQIISTSQKYCLEQYEEISDLLGKTVEVHTELEKETEIELETLKEFYDEKLTKLKQKNWPDDLALLYQNAHSTEYTFSLNSVCALGTDWQNWFAPELKASHNYALEYHQQKQYIGGFLKPVFLIWYHLHEGRLNATIITNEEAQDLIAKMQQQNLKNSWIATTLDTVVAGERPKGILANKDYLLLREQVQYFNGEFESLVKQETPLLWLKDQPTEKLDFFNHNLKLLRAIDSNSLAKIRSSLEQPDPAGYHYIAKNRFTDLSQFEWISLFPKIIPVHAVEYQKVAKVFQYMNKNWYHSELSINELQAQFNLPLDCIDYVNGHLDYLAVMKEIWHLLTQQQAESCFLNALSTQQKDCLKIGFGVPLDEINKKTGITDFPPNELNSVKKQAFMKADFQVIYALRSHPLFRYNTFFVDAFNKILFEKATSPVELSLFLALDDWDEDILDDILTHSATDASILKELLELPRLSEQFMLRLVEKIDTPENLTLFLSRKELSETTNRYTTIEYMDLFLKRQNLPPALIELIAQNAGEKVNEHQSEEWENCFIEVIKQCSSQQISALLKQFPASTPSGSLLFELMIETADSENHYLDELVQQDLSAEQIDQLLGHPSMNSDHADTLFAKDEFSKKINNWPWLTKEHIELILDETKDYESLQIALNHENLSIEERDAWLKDIQDNQKKNTKNSDEKLWNSLMAIKIKAYQHAIKALNDEKYADVAKVTFNLYVAFEQSTNNYFANPNKDTLQQLRDECKDNRDKATSVLSDHRGTKKRVQSFLNLLNSLLAIFTRRAPTDEKWTFFKSNTDTMNKTNKMIDTIDEYTKNDEGPM